MSTGNQKGQILITALILTLVIAFSFIATMNYVMTAELNAEAQAADADFNALVAQVQALMMREDSCRLTMGGPLTNLASPGGTTPVAFPPTAFAGPTPLVFPPVISKNIVLYYPNPAPPPPPPNPLVPFIGLATSTFGRLTNVMAVLTLTGVQSVTTLPFTTYAYSAQLQLSAARPYHMLGTTVVTTQTPINLIVRLNAANQVISCSTMMFTGPNPALPACAAGQALYNDAAGLRCVTVVCVPPFNITLPWNANGNANCT
jgi:hypothetical protein